MIDIALFTVGFGLWVLLAPGKTWIVASKLAKASMTRGQDVEVVFEHADGTKFSVIGVGMFNKAGESCVGLDLMIKPDTGEGYLLTTAERRLLSRVSFIKDCLRQGSPITERQIEAICQIAAARAEEIKATPRRKVRRV